MSAITERDREKLKGQKAKVPEWIFFLGFNDSIGFPLDKDIYPFLEI